MLATLEPQRSTAIEHELWIGALYHGVLTFCQIVVKKSNSPRIIVAKKCSQCINFVPRSIFVYDPFYRVLEGPKDIMKMNQNTPSETWENIKQFEAYVATSTQHMRRVYKQYV